MKGCVLFRLEELETVLKDYDFSNISFDIETCSTTSRKQHALSYYYAGIEGISIYNGTFVFYIDFINNKEKDVILKWLDNVFQTKVKNLAAHNIVFDLKIFHKLGIIIPETTKLYCSMVAAHLIDELNSAGLKNLAKRLLNFIS